MSQIINHKIERQNKQNYFQQYFILHTQILISINK